MAEIYIELDWPKIEDRNGLKNEDLRSAVNRYYGIFIKATMERYSIDEPEALDLLNKTPLRKLLQEFGFFQMRESPVNDLIEFEKNGWIKGNEQKKYG